MEKVSEILKFLAERNLYLMVMFDGEYKQYCCEILDPYGETRSAGLAITLEDAVREALSELENGEGQVCNS